MPRGNVVSMLCIFNFWPKVRILKRLQPLLGAHFSQFSKWSHFLNISFFSSLFLHKTTAMACRNVFSMFFCPAVFLSDNGSQMVGAARELRQMIQGYDPNLLRDFCAKTGTQWIFTTPASPHQNGGAEALVKSCKRAVKNAIGEQVLSPFELYTCFMEIGNLVNQRPIGRVPNDPDDGKYLCPNDMFLGRPTSEVP